MECRISRRSSGKEGTMNPSFEEGLTESLSRARAGDRVALEYLIAHLREWALLYVQKLPSSERRAGLDAEDIAQDVCMKVCSNLGSFQGRTTPQLLAWVRNVVRNAVVDSYRRSARQCDTRGEVTDRMMMSQLAGSCAGPEEEALRAEQVERLNQAAQRLSEIQRVVLELRMEGLTFAEVAERLGITVGSARGRFERAIARLRAEMEEPPRDRPRSPHSEPARLRSPLVSEPTTRSLTPTSAKDEADESVRRLYLRLGLMKADPSSPLAINWGKFERLLFGPGEEGQDDVRDLMLNR
jgi:RNA polymerase sigma-70 factor, ECF subfamily